LSWQGSVRVGVNSPAICGGTGKLNASKGAVYTATVAQNPPTGSLVAFRFKFRDPAAKGKPNTNCLDTSDPTGPGRRSAARPGARPSPIRRREFV